MGISPNQGIICLVSDRLSFSRPPIKMVSPLFASSDVDTTVEITVGKKWVFFSDYANARAAVTFDPEKVGAEALVKAVEAASSPLSAYKARLLEK